MALVERNGRPYLYKSVRKGGRVTSEYVASGRCAVLIAQLEIVDFDRKDYDRWLAKEEQRRIDELDRGLDELCARARALAGEALTEAGYHQHHRGEWRKRHAN